MSITTSSAIVGFTIQKKKKRRLGNKNVNINNVRPSDHELDMATDGVMINKWDY